VRRYGPNAIQKSVVAAGDLRVVLVPRPPSRLLIVTAAGCGWPEGLPPAAWRPRAGATCRRRAEAPGRRGGITQPFTPGAS